MCRAVTESSWEGEASDDMNVSRVDASVNVKVFGRTSRWEEDDCLDAAGRWAAAYLEWATIAGA